MIPFVLRRALSAVPTLFAIVTIAFFMMRLAPGGPFDSERALDAKVMANLRRIYRLDEPLYRQYLDYLGNLLDGNLGPSFSFRDFTVAELFASSLPISLRIGALALVLALIFGVALGTFAAFRQNSRADYLVMIGATVGVTVPNFVIAPCLQIVFGLWLAWLPVGGWAGGAVRNTVLPVIVLALPQIAVVARLMRASAIEILRSNHIRTLSANGLSGRVVLRHVLRGALLPVISYLGPAAAQVLTGSVIIEQIFGIPGVGRYFVEGALNRDYTLVMGTVVLIAVFVVVFNLIVDILYALLDPRVRVE